MPSISVIVPVYNVEKYLHACINSIVNQSFVDFELILIDDGSTDDSGSICDFEADKDSRITVLHKHNEGVSVARNTGIAHASCKWITFIDSDDTIENDYLEKLYIKVQHDDCDLITNGIRFDYENHSVDCRLDETSSINLNNESGFMYMIDQELITSPVAKLYRRELLLKENIQFNPSLSYGEDRDFNLKYLNVANIARSSSYVGYNYRIYSPGSLSKKNHNQRFMNDYTYWRKLKEFTDIKGFNSLVTKKLLTNRLFHFVSDQVISILDERISLLKKARLLKETFRAINDFDYIIENKNLIDGGNGILNYLILHRQSSFLLILSCFLHR
jgi:glycosyltransferase involved in cell wall biosynthesis